MSSGLEHWYCDTDRGKRTRRKTFPLQFCPTKILYGLTWAQIQTSALTGVIVKDSVHTAQQTLLISRYIINQRMHTIR